MRAPLLAAFTCLNLWPAAAWAVDWSLRSTQSETVEANDNQFVSPSPPGPTVSSYSSVTANAEARAPTSKFDFDSYVNYRKYWGPGTEGLQQTENLAYGFTGHYETFGKNGVDRNFLETSYTSSSAAFALLNQLGVLSPTSGTINTATARGGIDRALSARDTLSLSGQSTYSFYDPFGGGTPFTDTIGSAFWQHRVNSTAAILVSSQAEFLSYGNALGTTVLILRNQAGVDIAITPLLSFRGTIGPAYVQTQNGINTLTSASGSSNGALSSSVADWITDLLLTYKALKSTTFTLGATQTIGPSVVGSLFKTTTVRGGMSHTINSYSSISLAADVSRVTSSNTTDFASVSVTYSHQLAREWNAQISYRHLHRFPGTGTTTFDPITGTPLLSGTAAADSNSLLVVVSKSTTILPHLQ